jgi:hypothetical protein
VKRLGLALSFHATPVLSKPIHDATVDTVFGIITTSDPTAFECYALGGMAERQMWDKRIDAEIHPTAHIFIARFADGPGIEVTVNPEFTADEAEAAVARHLPARGRLPLPLRQGWKRLGIHKGDESCSAGPGLSFVYSGRTDWLLSFDHLEESLFHEGVQASLDADHASAEGWRAVRASDGAFMTGCAASDPEGEDPAETVFLAFGITPGNMPPVDTDDIRAAIPARLAYIAQEIPLVLPKAGATAGRCSP